MSRKGMNIYHRKDGRWEGRYIKEKADGKTKYGYVYGKSYNEVMGKLSNKALLKTKKGAENSTFACSASDWLVLIKPQLKPASIARYTNILNLYLLPQFGKQSIVEISRSDVYNFANELLTSGGAHSNGLAPKTVNSILSVVKIVFNYAAAEKGYSVANIKNICVKQPLKQPRVLSKAEQQKLSSYLKDNPTPCNLGILLSLYTGMRIGEVCALKWKDINFADQCIYVHHAMQRIQLLDNPCQKTAVQILAPKSECSIRYIPILSNLLPLLEHQKKCDDAFVLTGSEKKYIEPRCLENHFKAVLAACDLKDINFHALRHTFATRCIELGFDIKSLSEILGHSNVSITLNRYVHPSMELKQKNISMLSELFT